MPVLISINAALHPQTEDAEGVLRDSSRGAASAPAPHHSPLAAFQVFLFFTSDSETSGFHITSREDLII